MSKFDRGLENYFKVGFVTPAATMTMQPLLAVDEVHISQAS